MIGIGLGITRAALPRQSLPTVVFLGDSITEINGGISANPDYMYNGFFYHGLAYSGWTVTPVNKGIGGQTSAQMLARLSTDVLSLAPHYCHLLCGTNDIGQAIPTATTISNINSMVSQMRAAGIAVTIGTIPPRSTYTGTMQADTQTINTYIRGLAGVTVIDYYAAIDDGTGVALAGTLGDGVHPNRYGASRMGYKCAAWLASLPVRAYPLLRVGDPAQLLTDGFFTTGSPSALPPSWGASTAGGTAPVYGRAARPDGVGQWLTITNAAGCTTAIQSNAGSFSIGDTVSAEFSFEIAPSGSQTAHTYAVGLFLQFWNGSSFFSSVASLKFDASQDNDYPQATQGVLVTRPIAIPAGTTVAQVVIQCSGTGAWKVGRAAIRRH
jgi:lysophospholipase L1-like esterase